MKPPLFLRPLADAERQALRQGLRSPDAFTLRRCQILLASHQGQRPSRIATALGCSAQAVRDAIKAFHADGTNCLRAKSKAPKTVHAAWPKERDADLRALLHQSPRTFGQPTSLWTLPLVARVCHERGWTARVLSGEAIRLALKRLGVGWKRAKHWLTSPDPAYARKKKVRDELIARAAARPDWVLGWQDETWWTRLAQPDLFAWAGEQPLRLLPNERGGGKEALACYGLLRADTGDMLLRFVEGRPVSQVTEDYLGWLCERFAAEGKKVFVLVWDNAAWHGSKRVRRWIGAHNRRVQKEGGCKIRVCYLPVKAPWLNPIEPKWLHGKRAIVEPDRKLTATEVKQRVHEHYRCEPQEPLTQNAA
ncbi:MAG TPA: IS630 family transposase [Burkholderiales bacterium]|nr:IS630 family transposase [Burkholderiales bacterium]